MSWSTVWAVSFTLFCSDYLLIWGWPQRLKPFGQGNYFHKCCILQKKKRESHSFNQAVLMMGYSFVDWTKSSVVAMSCEYFDYGKKLSHHSILYPWLLCPVWIISTYFKLMGTGITFCALVSQVSFKMHLISCHLSVVLFWIYLNRILFLGLQQE